MTTTELPVELWQEIFHLATHDPIYSSTHDTQKPFNGRPYNFFNLWEYVKIRKSKLSLALLSKHSYSILTPSLYEDVRLQCPKRPAIPLAQLQSCGQWIKRLELPHPPMSDRDPTYTFGAVIKACPLVECLIKPETPATDRDDPTFWSPFPTAPLSHLRTLHWTLHSASQDDHVRLCEIFILAPQLEELHLRMGWPPRTTSSTMISRPLHYPDVLLPSLTTLVLERTQFTFSEFNLRPADMPKLTCVIAQPESLFLAQGSVDSHLLRAIGPQLQMLEIMAGELFDVERSHSTQIMMRCPNLQELRYGLMTFSIHASDLEPHTSLSSIYIHTAPPRKRARTTSVLADNVLSGVVWNNRRTHFALFSGAVLPSLQRVVLCGGWEPLVGDAEFQPMKQALITKGCSLQFEDGSAV